MKIRGWIGGGVKFLNEKNTPFVFRKFSSFYSNVYLLMHVNQQSTFACVAKGDSFTVVSRCTPCGIIAFHSFRYTCSIWNNILRSALSLSLSLTRTHTPMFIAQKHACLLHRSMHPILSGTDLVLPSWQVFEWKTYINGVFPGSWAPFTVMVLMHANQQSTVACVAKGDSFTVVSRSIWNNTLRSARAHTHTHTHVYCTEARIHYSMNWTCFTRRDISVHKNKRGDWRGVSSLWMKKIRRLFSGSWAPFTVMGSLRLNACELTVHSCFCGERGLLHCC